MLAIAVVSEYVIVWLRVVCVCLSVLSMWFLCIGLCHVCVVCVYCVEYVVV